jgi:phage shock protein PspC (stress-responsive transcriptional regulator)
MNKTVNINLAGLVFHIDENAYDRLYAYLEQLRKYFQNEEGSEEIIQDIEARIAELFQERLENKEVISLLDVDHIISIMGEAEQYTEEEHLEESTTKTQKEEDLRAGKRRRIFRDGDDRMVGGVCSGLAKYFDIDSLWLRIIFLLLLFMGGGFLIYIILWMVMPEAKTTAEKLEMQGEKVNISNIEKNIKKEFEKVESSLDNISQHPQTKKVGKKAQDISKKVTDFFIGLFKGVLALLVSGMGFIAIIFGVVIIMVLSSFFFADGVTISTIGSNSLSYLFDSDLSTSTFTMGAILFLLIPIIAVVLVGIRIVAGSKTSSNTKIGMLALWIVGLVLMITSFEDPTKAFKHHAFDIQIKPITFHSDTLYVDAENSDSNIKVNIGKRSNISLDSLKISGFLEFDVEQHDREPQLVFTKKAYSEEYDKAQKLAEDINYHWTLEENYLTLPDHFFLQDGSQWRMQKMKVALKIPAGTVVFLDQSLHNIIHDIENTHDMWDMDMLGHYWIMKEEGLTCLDCK